MTAVLAAVLLAAAPQTATVEAAVAAIYAPYSRAPASTRSWERPIFTRQTADLIAKWRAGAPQDEPDALSDGDWLCLCQDWDRQAFTAEVLSKREERGANLVSVRLDLGGGSRRDARLVLRREGGVWKLDDLYAAPDFPSGLKQKLQEVILENVIG